MRIGKRTVIRVLFTLAFIYGAYTETGIWTAICLFLIFLAIEVMTWKKGIDAKN